MKTPQELADIWANHMFLGSNPDAKRAIELAIGADRAQRDGLADGTGRFTAEFDKHAWASATVEAREEWINRAVDALNGEVYVTKVEVGVE